MNGRWGDSQRDRDALDRWITREEFDGQDDSETCLNCGAVLLTPGGNYCANCVVGMSDA